MTPRAPDGALRDARVEVVIAHGGGRLTTATRDATGWTATLTAPPAPGSAQLVIRVDGVPSRIKPRIWFD